MISLLLFGCGEEQVTTTGDVFIGGTRGLEFSFNTPFGDDSTGEDIIYETEGKSQDFDIEVNVKNEGEDEVLPGDVQIKLVGINKEQFNGIDQDMLVSNANPLGPIQRGVNYFEEEDISFAATPNGKISYNRNVTTSGKFSPQITAYGCYKYSTKASTNICFRDSRNKMTTCTNIGQKEVSTSGGPIQVTKVTQSPSSSKVNVNIEVKNVGSGTVYAYSATDLKWCNFNIDNKINENKLSVKVTSVMGNGNPNMDCDTTVRLVDGVGTIRCTRDIKSEDSFVEQVILHLDYMYQQTASHQFTIWDEGRYESQ